MRASSLIHVNRHRLPALGLHLLLLSTALGYGGQTPPGPQVRVEGSVLDQTGAVIPGAEVTLRAARWKATLRTDSQGRFIFANVPLASGSISVHFGGFSDSQQAWSAAPDGATRVEVRLVPQAAPQEVTVTATRTETRVGDTPASIVLLSSEELSTTAALTTDDLLRQVPGFNLFRRSSSLTANPSSQGVSLRGVGASGPSRAIVLRDGVPLNDPFGGWVYWDRVPRASLERIEILRGGSSDLYGTGALSGVINIFTRGLDQTSFSTDLFMGNEQTHNLSLAGSATHGKWSAGIAGEVFQTDGFVLVPFQQRGPIDTPAASEHATADVTLQRSVAHGGNVFTRFSSFTESRKNGTPFQKNNTRINELAMGADWQSAPAGAFSLRLYGGAQVFNQTFSAVAAGRASETPTRTDKTPAQQLGATLQWSRSVGERHVLVAGAEEHQVRGHSDQVGLSRGLAASTLEVGGRQNSVGMYGEELFRPGQRWLITAGLRIDHWHNYDGFSQSLSLSNPGPASISNFPHSAESALSPRLSVLFSPDRAVRVFASGYQSFRAPSLQELYRSFQVGNIVTLPNAALRAERLTGGEVGLNTRKFRGKVSVRGTLFWSQVEQPIANVTLSVTPQLITRQRQNLGLIRSRGLELESEITLSQFIAFSAGYQFVDATVVSFSTNRSLEGLQIPQVPPHQFTFQTCYARGNWTLAAQGRASSSQFDDDLNQLPLGSYFTTDLLLSRRVTSHVTLFASFENLFDQRYTVARTPVFSLGPPLLWQIGARVNLTRR